MPAREKRACSPRTRKKWVTYGQASGTNILVRFICFMYVQYGPTLDVFAVLWQIQSLGLFTAYINLRSPRLIKTPECAF